jgi:choice-of-anchor A domain-containing protein
MWTKFSDSPPYGFGEDRWIFQEINGITTGVFIEFSEGYGRLEGILVGLNDPNNMWKLNLEMVYLPELGSFHVKNELAAACASLQQDWWFYNIRSDCESLLVGMGENLGLTIVLGLEATGYYPIQVGPGASMKNSQPGFTTWLTYKEFRYNSTLWGSKPQLAFSHAPYGNNDGDLNINIECPSKCPPFPTPICGDGIVSGSEQCDDGPHGSPCCTTTCQFQPSGHPCRLSAGDCDVVEVCSGKSNVCPPDTYAPSTTVCLSGAGFCDLKVSTYCTGNSPICPGVPTIPLRQQQISWDNFNLISCLDFKAGSGDIEGRAAVKRNWNTTGGFSIGLKVDSTATGPDRRQDFSLVVGHNCSFAAGSILPDGSGNPNNSPEEDIFVGEVWTGPAYLSLRVRDQSAVIGDKDAYFDAGCSYFTSLSNYFAAQTPNTAWTPYYGSGIHIKCTSSVETLYYVQIDAASLSASNWWSLEQCNMAAFFVITVTGTGDVTFKGGAFPSVTEKVIFNVPGTGRTVDVETGLQGNLLAPGCSFKQTNGVTLGLVIVYTVLSFVQANKPNCLLWNPIQITGKVAGPIQSVPYPTPTKRYATTVSVIPVFDFGTWSVGDKVQIGNETCTIVGGTMSGDSPSLLCIPALTGSYDQGTDITGTVQLVDASWLRNTVNENMTYTPSDPDQSVAPSTGSQASSGSQPPLTTSPATIITDVTGASTGSSQPSETSSQLSSGKPATTVKLTGAETSSASSLAAYFAVILVTLTIALF